MSPPVGGRVLLVDDDDDHAILVQRALRRAGVEDVVRAADSADAIEIAQSSSAPDLVIVDLLLPGVMGYELIAKLREVDGWLDTPMVVLTGSAARTHRQKSYQHGANGYLVKPVDLTAFNEMVCEAARYWLTQRRLTDSEVLGE